MKLHLVHYSSYSRKVWSALVERRERFELHELNYRGGELQTPEFIALSPFGRMPVLETSDGALYETTSIIEYLEERGPRVLLPQATERMARHFDRIGDLYLLDPMAKLWWRTGDDGAAERQTVLRAWSVLRAQLSGQRFLCGARFTLADLSAALGTDYLMRLGMVPPPEIVDWCRRCHDETALGATLEKALPALERLLQERVRARGADARAMQL